MLNKRGDFAATFLSGRLVVAGGLSESLHYNRAVCLLCRHLTSAGC